MIRPFIQFYTTQRCNSNCRHCYLAALKNEHAISYEDEMTTEQTLKAFEILRKMGFSMVSFGGAEPTQKLDFFDIVKEMSKMGYSLKVHTNGMTIDESGAKILKSSGIFEIRISLDGSNREINDFIRGEGAFDALVTGIKNCTAQEIPTTVAVTINKKNITDLANIIDYSYQLGVRGVHSYLLIDKGRGISLKDYLPDENDLIYAHKVFETKRSEYHGSKGIDPKKCLCKQGTCYLELKQNGDVYLYEDSRAYFGIGVSKIGSIFEDGIEEKIDTALIGQKLPDCCSCEYYASFMCAEMDNYCFDDIKF